MNKTTLSQVSSKSVTGLTPGKNGLTFAPTRVNSAPRPKAGDLSASFKEGAAQCGVPTYTEAKGKRQGDLSTMNKGKNVRRHG